MQASTIAEREKPPTDRPALPEIFLGGLAPHHFIEFARDVHQSFAMGYISALPLNASRMIPSAASASISSKMPLVLAKANSGSSAS